MYQIGLKKFLCQKKRKILICGHMLLVILKAKKLFECFTKKELQKKNQKELKVEKVIQRKGDKIDVKWKGYDNSFKN